VTYCFSNLSLFLRGNRSSSVSVVS